MYVFTPLKKVLLLLLHYVTEFGGCFQMLYWAPCIYRASSLTTSSEIPFQALVETSSCKHENNNDNSNDNNNETNNDTTNDNNNDTYIC